MFRGICGFGRGGGHGQGIEPGDGKAGLVEVAAGRFTDFLGGQGTARDVALHLEHMIALGGEDHVALGSDFDGCGIHPSLAGIELLEVLNSELERYGFAEAQRKKFFWSNAVNAFAA